MTANIRALGVVVIGRNEGSRLLRCLESLICEELPVVYVDSGSTDASVAGARMRGASTVDLDMSQPFTAARARNAGYAALMAAFPTTRYVQFVDGDCEVSPGWIGRARAFLEDRPDTAAVCGRRRERYPSASVYNWLCDEEWNTPVGEAIAFGGDAMLRVAAFAQAGGYRDTQIAGEEPELCVRLREKGWKIWRIDAEMTVHDAAITRFSQWWKRNVRTGYAFVSVWRLHARSPCRIWRKESLRPVLWAGLFPLGLLAGGAAYGWAGLAPALLYPLQIVRLAAKRGATDPRSWTRAAFLMLAKFAELVGIGRYVWSQFDRRAARIIEYKS